MIVHFCNDCGLRIDAPGKCKACDPQNGRPEASDPVESPAPNKPAAKSAK